jgi:hypothetical protein
MLSYRRCGEVNAILFEPGNCPAKTNAKLHVDRSNPGFLDIPERATVRRNRPLARKGDDPDRQVAEG